MHPVRCRQEQPTLRRDGQRIADQVFERRYSGALGMDALADLGQLVRVAEQDQRSGRAGDGEGIGEAQLTGLVDEQDIDRTVELRS